MSTAWTRIKSKTNTAVNDLAILAKYVPQEKQHEIFTKKNIESVITFLIDNKLNKHRKVDLAAILVEKGIEICKDHYKNLSEDMPETAQVGIDYLDRAKNMCNDIAYKSSKDHYKDFKKHEREIFMFEWNSVKKENKTITQYLRKKFSNHIFGITNLGYSYRLITLNETKTSDTVVGTISSMEGEFRLKITLDKNNQKAALTITNDQNTEVFRENLLVNLMEDKFLIYYKK